MKNIEFKLLENSAFVHLCVSFSFVILMLLLTPGPLYKRSLDSPDLKKPAVTGSDLTSLTGPK